MKVAWALISLSLGSQIENWLAGGGNSELKACAETKDPACVYHLGEDYLTGLSGRTDTALGIQLIDEAANLGYPPALFARGALGSAGLIETSSIRDFLAASSAGHEGGLLALGFRHRMGFQTVPSCHVAMGYYHAAIRLEYPQSEIPQAQEIIRLSDNSGKRLTSHRERNFFLRMVEAGDVEMKFKLGMRYLMGFEGFPKNYTKAFHFFQEAADERHKRAPALLGYLYLLGVGVDRNVTQAKQWFQSIVDVEDSSAKELGMAYNGLALVRLAEHPGQFKQSEEYFEKAKAYGNTDGLYNLGALYLARAPLDSPVRTVGIQRLTEAMQAGNPRAIYTMASMYYHGENVFEDCSVALSLLKVVAEREPWVNLKLQQAYVMMETSEQMASWLFFLLAEAGVEIGQANLAYLLNHGQTLFNKQLLQAYHRFANPSKGFSQRYYELSASQGIPSAYLRLGDMALEGTYAIRQEGGELWPHQDLKLGMDFYRVLLKLPEVGAESSRSFKAESRFNLGVLYFNGSLGTPDYRRANELFSAALLEDTSSEEDSDGDDLAFSTLFKFLNLKSPASLGLHTMLMVTFIYEKLDELEPAGSWREATFQELSTKLIRLAGAQLDFLWSQWRYPLGLSLIFVVGLCLRLSLFNQTYFD